MDKKKKRLLWQVPFLCFLIVGTILIVRSQRSMPYQHNEGMVYGTVYSVTYQYDRDLQKEIEAELKKVDNSLSMFNKESIISRVNANEDVELNNMFIDVFTLAQSISNETGGAFDITVAPLVNAWGFGFKGKGPQPTAAQVDSMKQYIGYQMLTLAGKKLKKEKPQIMLDCSAIAKGYGSDVVARYLKRLGISNYMVEIGGEVVTKGNSPRRVPWKIGVEKPVDDSLAVSNNYEVALNVTDMAMATSGNYRNFYYQGDKKFAHTIDPHTGRPVQHTLLSATVLAKDCATADGYATAFMVLGIDKAKAVLERHPELMAYFIYSDAQGNYCTWYSPTMEEKIVK